MADERSIDGRKQQKTEPERQISPEKQAEDGRLDYALRPQSLDEMIGQERLRDKMRILVEAARPRGIAGSCAALRPARPGQDDAQPHPGQRDAGEHEAHRRASD
ncbi:MAG: hypothetical protein R2856_00045 [Caldilineaceae bacterium]